MLTNESYMVGTMRAMIYSHKRKAGYASTSAERRVQRGIIGALEEMRHRRGGKDRLGQLVILQAPSEMALRVAEGLILIDRIGVERHRFHLE